MADDMALIFNKEKDTAGLLQANPTPLNSAPDRLHTGLTLLLIIFICALNVFLGNRLIYFDSSPEAVDAPIRDSHLHILIPTGGPPHLDLCRTVLSAAILNYSTPAILNRGSRFHDLDLSDGESSFADMLEIKNYLNEISRECDDDLVLIIDGSETWFQLHPDELIQRYYDLNLAANKSLKQRVRSLADTEGITQTIVFSAQNSCDEDVSNETCNTSSKLALPNDTLDAVTCSPDPNRQKQDLLLGCQTLSTSLIMGPVNDLRKLFSTAYELSRQSQSRGTSRDLLAQIFHEQQHQREILRQQHLPLNWRFLANIFVRLGLSCKSILTPFSTHKQTSRPGNTTREFGIGLDHSGKLAFSSPDRVALCGSTELDSVPVMVQHASASDWGKMWWKPHMRPFLDMHFEAERGPIAEVQGRRWWSAVKGRGGVVVSNAGWMGWKELCGGWAGELEVFGNVEWADDGEI